MPTVAAMVAAAVNDNFGAESLFVEICCGSAKLSYCIANVGKPTISIDHDRNRHSAWKPAVKIDLSLADQCAVILGWILDYKIDMAWLALPCGTGSRARDIVIAGGPPPLRSESFVRGLPNLTDRDLQRVLAANSIYDNSYVLILALLSVGAKVVIENPSRSWLWSFPEYQQLQELGLFDVEFQHCKWNGDEPSRNKWTRLRTNESSLMQLQGPCKAAHEHLPWGKQGSRFVTADEAEYPMAMCEAIASCLYPTSDLAHKELQTSPHQLRRFTAGRQPRGRKAHAIIPEFDAVLTLSEEAPPSEWRRELRHFYARGAEGSEEDAQQRFRVVGIWRPPQEYIDLAQKAKHPVDYTESMPEVLRNSIKYTLESSPGKLAQHLVESIKHLTKLVQDFSAQDEQVLASMDANSRKIYHNKKLATLQHLLEDFTPEWPDRKLVSDIISGFQLTGHQPYTGVFEKEVDLNTMAVETLRQSSDLNNTALMARTKTAGCPDLDKLAWSKTLEELEAGWLQGPYDSVDQIKDQVGLDAPHISRRFAITQGQKIRLIDDYLESNVNATYSCEDKLTLMDVDFIAAILRVVEACLSGEASILQDLDVTVGSHWNSAPWLGTTIDLKSAYKQLSVKSSELWASVVSVFDPIRQRPVLFIQSALPFGASASVLNFNRVSRYLWYLGTKFMKFIWANFFDDYPIISSQHLAKPTLAAAHLFFGLLGWEVAKGDKQVPFAESFNALGVSFQVGSLHLSMAFVANSAKRTADMIHLLEEVLVENKLTRKHSEVLRGKLQFVESNLFGKIGKSMYTHLFRVDRPLVNLNQTDIVTVKDLIDWLKEAKPRKLSPVLHSSPVLIFTDGACEPSETHLPLTTCGGLIINNNFSNASRRQLFGLALPDSVLEPWAVDDKRQLVTEAELSAVYISLHTWAHSIPHHRVFVFIDSEPALFSLIRGTSNTQSCAHIVRECHRIIEKYNLFVWFIRIPSKSNPADGPSRLLLKESAKLFDASIVTCNMPNFVFDSLS